MEKDMRIHWCGNKIVYTDYKGVKSAKVKRYCYKKQVDIFQNREYNISTKRGISSWKQDTKHKVFASVALATLKLCIYSLA